MSTSEKADMVIRLLGDESISLETVEAYLSFAESAIIAHKYANVSNKPTEFPSSLEPVQIQAVIAGLSMSGAENQLSHTENGISRTFKYSDMLQYIQRNVPAYVGVF